MRSEVKIKHKQSHAQKEEIPHTTGKIQTQAYNLVISVLAFIRYKIIKVLGNRSSSIRETLLLREEVEKEMPLGTMAVKGKKYVRKLRVLKKLKRRHTSPVGCSPTPTTTYHCPLKEWLLLIFRSKLY